METQIDNQVRPLFIKSTKDTPRVILDSRNNIFEFSEKSLTINAYEFYKPIMSWFDEYAKNSNEATIINFKLSFINSSSIKAIFILLKKLDLMNQSHKIKINWFYHEDDLDMLSAIVHSYLIFNMQIELISMG